MSVITVYLFVFVLFYEELSYFVVWAAVRFYSIH